MSQTNFAILIYMTTMIRPFRDLYLLTYSYTERMFLFLSYFLSVGFIISCFNRYVLNFILWNKLSPSITSCINRHPYGCWSRLTVRYKNEYLYTKSNLELDVIELILCLDSWVLVCVTQITLYRDTEYVNKELSKLHCTLKQHSLQLYVKQSYFQYWIPYLTLWRNYTKSN